MVRARARVSRTRGRACRGRPPRMGLLGQLVGGGCQQPPGKSAPFQALASNGRGFDPEGTFWGFSGATLCDIPRGQVTARKRLPAIVRKLRAWREKNGLSQSQAVAVLKRAGLQTSISSWEKWEMGLRQPAPLSIPTLEAFLEKHPVVTNPPRSAPRRRKK